MSAESFARALAARGIDCRVEGREKLAVLVMEDASVFADPAMRRELHVLASAHGFSHVALELTEEGETLSGG